MRVRIGLALAASLICAALLVVRAQTPAAPAAQTQPPAQTQQAGGITFEGNAGIINMFIKPDKTADFEDIIKRLQEALAKSEKPERKQQAAGWKVYKSRTPGPNGTAVYIHFIDPVVPSANYAVSTILYEAFPNEAQAIFAKYKEAYAGGGPVNLDLVANLSK